MLSAGLKSIYAFWWRKAAAAVTVRLEQGKMMCQSFSFAQHAHYPMPQSNIAMSDCVGIVNKVSVRFCFSFPTAGSDTSDVQSNLVPSLSARGTLETCSDKSLSHVHLGRWRAGPCSYVSFNSF